MNIFVGNLAFEAKEADVYKLFMGFGKVASVSIVMDKKGKNSRGFGFLEMPDEQQAQSAITALNKKVFMGRPLNVEPARSKLETGRENRNIDDKSRNEVKPGFNPKFKRTGRYRQGRRTLSFLRKHAEAGIEEPARPPKKHHDNPMRWRKNPGQSRPWQKKRGELKPWQKSQGESKPWKKSGVESEPRKMKSLGKKSGEHKSGGFKRPAYAKKK